MLSAGLLIALMAMPWQTFAGEATLRYAGTNQWVAEADNAPLRKLFREVTQGRQAFTVILPSQARPLSEARLIVLLQLLERQSGKSGIVLEEAAGRTGPNTLKVRW